MFEVLLAVLAVAWSAGASFFIATTPLRGGSAPTRRVAIVTPGRDGAVRDPLVRFILSRPVPRDLLMDVVAPPSTHDRLPQLELSHSAHVRALRRRRTLMQRRPAPSSSESMAVRLRSAPSDRCGEPRWRPRPRRKEGGGHVRRRRGTASACGRQPFADRTRPPREKYAPFRLATDRSILSAGWPSIASTTQPATTSASWNTVRRIWSLVMSSWSRMELVALLEVAIASSRLGADDALP